MLLPYPETLNRTCNVGITESQFPIGMTGNATKCMSRRGGKEVHRTTEVHISLLDCVCIYTDYERGTSYCILIGHLKSKN